MRDPRLPECIVEDVVVSRDLSYAKIYVSSPVEDVNEQEIIAVFMNAAGFLRSALAKSLNLRKTPELQFHYDNSFKNARKIEALIHKACASDRPLQSDNEEE